MKVYSVWDRYSHDYDMLIGLYRLEEKAVEVASKYAEGKYGSRVTFPDGGATKWESPKVNVCEVTVLHTWTDAKNCADGSAWETVTVEENVVE